MAFGQGAMITRGAFPIFMKRKGLDALINKVWDKHKIEEMRQWYFNMKSTDDPFIQMYGMIGMGNARRKPEGMPTPFDSIGQGRPLTIVQPSFGLGASISREAQDDDKQNILVPTIMKELKNSVYEAMETDAVDFLENGFYYQGWEPDGQPLFAPFHPVIRQQPGLPAYWANRHPTDAALSITALDSAWEQYGLILTDSGRLVKAMYPKYLDVHPRNRALALQILRSARILGNNFNDPNVYQGELQVRINPRIQNPNSWFLSGDLHEWDWYNRVEPEINTDVDYFNGATMMVVYSRWGRGAYSGRGKWGSKGP